MIPEATTSISIVKNASYAMAFIATAEFLGLTAISVQVLSILIVADVFTGILKSGSINGWNSIKSSVLQRGVIAKTLLIIAPFTLAFAGKGIGVSFGALSQSVINILILSESYSIIGNLYAIRTGKDKEEFDAVAFVLQKIRELLKRVILEDESSENKK